MQNAQFGAFCLVFPEFIRFLTICHHIVSPKLNPRVAKHQIKFFTRLHFIRVLYSNGVCETTLENKRLFPCISYFPYNKYYKTPTFGH